MSVPATPVRRGRRPRRLVAVLVVAIVPVLALSVSAITAAVPKLAERVIALQSPITTPEQARVVMLDLSAPLSAAETNTIDLVQAGFTPTQEIGDNQIITRGAWTAVQTRIYGHIDESVYDDPNVVLDLKPIERITMHALGEDEPGQIYTSWTNPDLPDYVLWVGEDQSVTFATLNLPVNGRMVFVRATQLGPDFVLSLNGLREQMQRVGLNTNPGFGSVVYPRSGDTHAQRGVPALVGYGMPAVATS